MAVLSVLRHNRSGDRVLANARQFDDLCKIDSHQCCMESTRGSA